MNLFDEIITTTVKQDGKAEVEVELPSPTPEEVERAVAEFVRSAKNFARVNGGSTRFATNEWWQEMQWLALADADLKTIFCGRDRSPRSIQQYHRYRLKMEHAISRNIVPSIIRRERLHFIVGVR